MNKITLTRNPVFSYFKRNGGVFIAIIIMCILTSVLSPYFLTSYNFLQVLKQISTTSIVTFGMCIVLISGEIDLSVGSGIALSGCTCVVLMRSGFNPAIAILAGIGVGALVGFVNGFIISRTELPSFLVTLGMQSIARGCAYFTTGGLSLTSDNAVLAFIGNGKIFGVPFLVIVVIICMFICWLLMNKTVLGRGIFARGSNRDAARYAGINVKNVCLVVYIVVGVLTGIAGVMMAGRLSSAQPSVAQGLEGDCIAAAVLGGTAFTGGVGTIGGAFLGVMVIGIMNNAMNLLELSSFWQMVVKGVVIIAAVYIDLIKKNREKSRI